jgi:hydrogenase nickel incorporation protein HypA/HybF
MHELSIAMNLVDLVRAQMKGREQAAVRAIGVRVGDLVDLSAEALQTGFQIACADTSLMGSVLEIEAVPVVARCRACGRPTEVVRQFFLCAHCLSADVEITSGLELDLSWIEVDEAPPP